MKKIFLTLLLLCSIAWWGFTQNATTIDPELQAEMNLRAGDELIDINIILKSQYDQMELRKKSNFFEAKENKRAFVVNELKHFSEESQRGIINELQSLERGSKVADVRSFWIFNGINCKATTEVIETLASNPDILIIGYNRRQKLLPENEKPMDVEITREIVYGALKVNADDVWALGFTGEGVIIAVIDTGVNYNHVDVADHLWEHPDFPYHGYDFINNDNNPMDDNGHGSHCAGTVCGDGTAGSQTGMAPDATLMAIKVLDDEGSGNISGVCSGVEFAVEHGAHVFSMSLGFYGGGSNTDRIMFRNVMIGALEAGVVGAVAAGNEGDDSSVPVPINVRVPGNCPPPWLHPDQTITGGLTCVVCVGATNQNDNIAYFSSRGPVTWQSVPGFNDYAYNPGIGLIRPDVCAPGVNIKSLKYNSNTGYTEMDGTSMATPCVAGVMGLMLSKNLNLSPAEIDEILETTAHPLSTSKSNIYGSGRIDALAAVEAVPSGQVLFNSLVINDEDGNNNGKLNPGETVKLSISMENILDEPVNEVMVMISCNNPLVTVSEMPVIYGHFNPHEIITKNNAFTLTLSEEAPVKQEIQLTLEAASMDRTSVSRCKIMVYGYNLTEGLVIIDDAESNANNILEPGETAKILLYVNNSGNDFASGLVGTLTTTFDGLTIHTDQASYGSLFGDMPSFAEFSVTLSETVAIEDINIPLTLTITDRYGKESELHYLYRLQCNVIFDLNDSWGDGWNNAKLIVSFDDGTPDQQYTISTGNHATYTQAVNYGTTVTLTWHAGFYDNECSFSVSYEDGDEIYSIQGPNSGVLYSWVNQCLSSGGGNVSTCHHVHLLEATTSPFAATLSWDACPAANAYDVYRDFELIASQVVATEYVDESLPLGDYCYFVVAHCNDGSESNPSNEACVTIVEPCDAPQNLTAVSAGWNAELSWDAIANALSYTLYRDDELLAADLVEPHYTDLNLPEGDYCYSVAAVCQSGASDLSDSACISIVALHEMDDNRYTIFPNPAHQTLNISGDDIDNVVIFNILGQKMNAPQSIENGVVVLNTAVLPTGTYMLSISSSTGKTVTKRVVVAH